MDQYVEAALNKVEIARRDLESLNRLRDGHEDERIEIQRYFEGVITAGSSAGDQLAQAFAERLGLNVRNNSPQRLLAAAGEAPGNHEVEACFGEFRRWASTPIVRDAHKRRRLAVHHHYVKTPNKLLGTWLLEAADFEGSQSPYRGRLDVHSYCEVYVRALDALRVAAQCLARKAG